MKRAVGGFTLVELLVVIGVIAVILSISIFGIGGARKGSRDTKRKANIETIRSAAELYKSDNDGYPASLTELTNGGYLGAVPADPISTQGYDYIVNTGNCDCASDPVCQSQCLLGAPPPNCLTNCSSYEVWASLENPSTYDASCTTFASSNCGTGTCNYCATNP